MSLYTSGYKQSIEKNLSSFIIRQQPCEVNDTYQFFNISINMTEEAHQSLNGVLTVLGRNPTDDSVTCTSFPSARYYIQTIPPTSSTPGESIAAYMVCLYNLVSSLLYICILLQQFHLQKLLLLLNSSYRNHLSVQDHLLYGVQ